MERSFDKKKHGSANEETESNTLQLLACLRWDGAALGYGLFFKKISNPKCYAFLNSNHRKGETLKFEPKILKFRVSASDLNVYFFSYVNAVDINVINKKQKSRALNYCFVELPRCYKT